MSLDTPGVMVAAILKPSKYIGVSLAALLAYDYSLTVAREATLIWPSPWSTVKVLFFLVRYLPFLDVCLVLFYKFDPSISETACRVSVFLGGWTLVVGIGASEAILFIRTWALWKRSKRIAVSLSIIFAACAVTMSIFLISWMKEATFGYNSGLEGGAKCFMGNVSTKVDAGGIGVIIFLETIVMTLTVVHLTRQYRRLGAKPLLGGVVGVLYRDGIFFFVYMLAISVVNLLVVILSHEHVSNILLEVQHVLHSAVSARVLFHLHDATNRHKTASELASDIVGVAYPSSSLV